MPVQPLRTVIPFPDRRPALTPSLTIYQTHEGGLVSIDAMVPFSVAAAMLVLLSQHESQRSKNLALDGQLV